MAKRGTAKRLSVEHEEWIAKKYGGIRSKSSGASVTDLGDVRVEDEETLFECKGKWGELVDAKPIRSTLVSQFEKIYDEAAQGGKAAAMALRFYMPGCSLANRDGFVDLTIRLTSEDAYLIKESRDWEYNYNALLSRCGGTMP